MGVWPLVYNSIHLHTNPSFNPVPEVRGRDEKKKQVGKSPVLRGWIDLPDTCPAIPKTKEEKHKR